VRGAGVGREQAAWADRVIEIGAGAFTPEEPGGPALAIGGAGTP
jgi:hypothetical protein